MGDARRISAAALMSGAFAASLLYIRGYTFGFGNHITFIPVIRRILDPQYLAGDFHIHAQWFYHHNFSRLCALLSSLFGMQTAFFLGYVLSLALVAWAIIFLCDALGLARRVPALVLVALVVWGSQGIEINTFYVNRMFEAQVLAWPIGIFAAGLWIRRKMLGAALVVAACALLHFHVGMALAGSFVLSLWMGWKSEPRSRLLGAPALILVCLAPVIAQLLPRLIDAGSSSAEFYLPYIHFRAPKHYEFSSLRVVASFALIPVMGSLLVWTCKKREFYEPATLNAFGRLNAIVWVLWGFGLLHYLDYYGLRVGTIAKMQFIRMSPFVHMYYLLCLAVIVDLGWRRSRFLGAIVVLVLINSVGLPFDADPTVKLWKVKHKSFRVLDFESQYESDPWLNACTWIRNNAPDGAVFITPPNGRGFTAHAERSTIAEFKANPFLTEDAQEWMARLEDLSQTKDLQSACSGFAECDALLRETFGSLDEDTVLRIAEKYEASYLLTYTDTEYPFDLAFENAEYRVYSLP